MDFSWKSLQVQSCHLGISKTGVPKPRHGPVLVLVQGLLGTRPHSRRWVVGYSSEASSAVSHCLSYPLNRCPLLTFGLSSRKKKLSSTKLVPGAKKVRKPLSKRSSSPKLLFGPMLLSFLNKFAIRFNYFVCS